MAAGFTQVGDGTGSNGCMDINECASDNGGCTPLLASCNNTIGGYTCSCIAGYVGNGMGSIGCIDIDECTPPILADCSSNATCTNVPGLLRICES